MRVLIAMLFSWNCVRKFQKEAVSGMYFYFLGDIERENRHEKDVNWLLPARPQPRPRTEPEIEVVALGWNRTLQSAAQCSNH